MLDKEFWDNRYKSEQTGWDIGYPSTPLKEFIDDLENNDLHILIPGCGNAHEARFLHSQGFNDVHIIDIVKEPLVNFTNAHPNFPKNKVIHGDFFEHTANYDVIIEQTFFCALNPKKRKDYVQQMKNLLSENGRLVGVMFGIHLPKMPPYGGDKAEYESLFSPFFYIKTMEECYNSIAPREGTELFFIAIKKHP